MPFTPNSAKYWRELDLDGATIMRSRCSAVLASRFRTSRLAGWPIVAPKNAEWAGASTSSHERTLGSQSGTVLMGSYRTHSGCLRQIEAPTHDVNAASTNV